MARPLANWVTRSSKNWPSALATSPVAPSRSRRLTSSIAMRNRGAASPPGSMLTRAFRSKPNFRHPSGVCRLRAIRSVIGPLTGARNSPSILQPTRSCRVRASMAINWNPCTIPRYWPGFSKVTGGSFSMIPPMKSLSSRTSAEARAARAGVIAAQTRRPRAVHRLHPAIATHPPGSPPAALPTVKSPGVLPAIGPTDQRNRPRCTALGTRKARE